MRSTVSKPIRDGVLTGKPLFEGSKCSKTPARFEVSSKKKVGNWLLNFEVVPDR